MGGPYYRRLGRIAAQLVLDPSWAHRRKEAVTLLDDSYIRRELTVDYQLPDDSLARQGPDGPLYAVPVTLLAKSPPAYVNFDFRDETNRPLSLMTRAQNARVSAEALIFAADRALSAPTAHAPGQALPAGVERKLRAIARGTLDDPLVEEQFLSFIEPKPYDRAARALREDAAFLWLLTATVDNSVVMCEVAAADGRRRILKLGWDERVVNFSEQRSTFWLAQRGLYPYSFIVTTPYIGAATYHFELRAPDGLEVVESELRDSSYLGALDPEAAGGPDGAAAARPRSDLERRMQRGTRVHLYVEDAQESDRALAQVSLRVQREGFVASAAIISAVVAALIVIALIFADPVVEHSRGIPALLLLFPGILATLIARAGDHQLTIRMLARARRLLFYSAACAYLSAAALALSASGPTADPTTLLKVTWSILAIVASWSAIVLYAGRMLPRVPERRGLLETLVAALNWLVAPVRRAVAAQRARVVTGLAELGAQARASVERGRREVDAHRAARPARR